MRAAGIGILVAWLCVAASAQYSVVSEAEFKTACGSTVPAPLRMRAEGYRMTLETRSSMVGRPSTDYESRSVTTYQDRSKWHRSRESTFGTTKRVSEEIGFDGKIYIREGDGAWTEQPAAPSVPNNAPPQTEPRYLSVEYRLLPDELLRGQKVRVCEKFELAAVKVAGSELEARRESTARYWVNDVGLLKSENFYRNTSEKSTTTSWIKNEWEIDPTIKVELPPKPQ